MLPGSLECQGNKAFLSTLEEYKIPVKTLSLMALTLLAIVSYCNGQYFLQKKYVDEIKRCFDGFNLLMMPLYEEEIHGRKFLT